MLNKIKIIDLINQGNFDNCFFNIYKDDIKMQRERYIKSINDFSKHFDDFNEQEIRIFSAPGRTEISGNHTDHNLGKVIAGSVNLDVIAVVKKTKDNIIKIKSEGHDIDIVNLDNLDINEKEYNKSISLIRGIASRFKQLGYEIGGFEAYTTSNVLKGSGLSSSAAFEVLVGTVLNGLYNKWEIASIEIAKIAQYAENEYFGKPCGLMDQMACSVGGIISIDFANTLLPKIEKINFDFSKSGYSLCIVDTGGNHADLTNDYADVPKEMKSVANLLGCDVLRQISYDDILQNIELIREKLGDRALLRAIHFLFENKRVSEQIKALNNDDFELFKEIVIESGNSSYKYLQNVFSSENFSEQGIALALCLAENFLVNRGAYRVHGGGFAGTIQCFVPFDLVKKFKINMEKVFGEGSCHILTIRPFGGIEIKINGDFSVTCN